MFTAPATDAKAMEDAKKLQKVPPKSESQLELFPQYDGELEIYSGEASPADSKASATPANAMAAIPETARV
jgi:hypothetical protein